MLQEPCPSLKAAAILPSAADGMETSDQIQEPSAADGIETSDQIQEPTLAGASPGIKHSHPSDAPPPPTLLQSADPPDILAAPTVHLPQANEHDSSLATSDSPPQTMTPEAAAAPGSTQVPAAKAAAQAAGETAEAMQWQATDAKSQQQATDFVSQHQQSTSIIHPAIPLQAIAGLHPSLSPPTHQDSLLLPQPHHPSASAQPSIASHLLTDSQAPHGSNRLIYEANETAAGSGSRPTEDVQITTAYSGQRFSPEQAEAPAGPLEDAAAEELMLSDLAELLTDATAEPVDSASLHCSGGAQQQSMPLQQQQPTSHDSGARPEAAEQVFEGQDMPHAIPQNDLLSQIADGLDQEADAIVAPAGSLQNPTEDPSLGVHVSEHLDSNLLSEGAMHHAPASEELQNGVAQADSLEDGGLACLQSDPLSDMPATGSTGPDAVHDSMVFQPQNGLLPGEANPQQNDNDTHAAMSITVEDPDQPLEQNDLSVYNVIGTKRPIKQVDDVECSEDAIKRQCVTLQGLS